jgi:hypothetical protein
VPFDAESRTPSIALKRGIQSMNDDFIECPEVVGKQIEALRIFKDTGEGTELQIDFPTEQFLHVVSLQSRR